MKNIWGRDRKIDTWKINFFIVLLFVGTSFLMVKLFSMTPEPLPDKENVISSPAPESPLRKGDPQISREAPAVILPEPAVEELIAEEKPLAAPVGGGNDSVLKRLADDSAPLKNRIAGEWLLKFGDLDAFRNFLQQATDRHGLVVVDSNEVLRTVRVRADPGADLEELFKNLPLPDNLAPNYTVYTPDYPDRQKYAALDTLKGFNNNALDWLGVNGGNEEWGKGVLVAVLDTGILPHDSLDEQRLTFIDMVKAGTMEESAYRAHGTSVAAIIGGDDQYAPGVAPQAELLSVRVLDENGEGDVFSVAKGIVAAVDQGAEIINLSLGTTANSPFLQEAVKYALDNGAVLVAAAGNEGGKELMYPARYEGVIGVGSVDLSGQVPPFSNQGEGLDVMAPGYGVHTACEDNQTCVFSGSSASAGFISGALAYLLSSDANLTPRQAAEIIVQNADDGGLPGWDSAYGYGILDLERLQKRNEAYHDLAIAGFAMPADGAGQYEASLVIGLQNRGTLPVDAAHLTVTINDVVEEYEIAALEPGASEGVYTTIDLQMVHSGKELTIKAEVVRRGDGEEARQDNNIKLFNLLPVAPETP